MAVFRISCDIIKERVSKTVKASNEKEAREKFMKEIEKGNKEEFDNFEVEKVD